MTDPSHKILLAIPSINGATLLARMLPTLRFPPSQVVVLDQGSTDETVAVCSAAGVEVVQLDKPHTYTQACNIGASLAKDRGAKYVCVSNNDITFRTDVLAELADEMDADPQLGIVAPSQVIIDPSITERPVSYRVFWKLDQVSFFHDTAIDEFAPQRVEADFCELTCALVRLSAIDAIGFLDDEYGFYHEDADFGFRLRRAGFSCAYLPRSQIEHYSSSTFNLEKQTLKANYIAKNKVYFAQKNLGLGVSYVETGSSLGQLDFDEHAFQAVLGRYGLLSASRPKLAVSYPDSATGDYLLTTYWGEIPQHWRKNAGRFKAVFATSRPMCDAFADAGFESTFHIPLGIDPDVFQPWGPASRLADETTYLSVVDQGTDALPAVLTAWRDFVAGGAKARLVLLGRGLTDVIERAPDQGCRLGNIDVARFSAERIDIYETLHDVTTHHLARLYRSVDFVIANSATASEAIGLLQAHASGVPCLFPMTLATMEFTFDGALTYGHEGRFADLAAALAGSVAIAPATRHELGRTAMRTVRARNTVRNSVMGIYNALARLQERAPEETVASLRRRQTLPQANVFGGDAGRSEVLRLRLSGVAARRVKTLGRLTLQLGSIWEEKGFVSASRATTAELKLFLQNRSRQMSRFGGGAVMRVSRRGRDVLNIPGRRKPRQTGTTLLIGYIDAQLGLGQSLRGLARAMASVGARFGIYPFGIGVEGRRGEPYMPERYDTRNPHDVNVIEVTPDELPVVYQNIGENHFRNSYNILRTYWELSVAPDVWRPKVASVDEIWAPNEFVADAFRNIFDKPITVVPPCIVLPDHDRLGRPYFDLDDDRWYFLFSFDYYSFPQRKNPLAVVRAFLRAFPDQSAYVGLIIKSIGPKQHFPEITRELEAAMRRDGRIRLIDASLSRQEMLSLMAASDCYVSLHRSEGFGLGMAEAMALGKPVIGTDYSGNTEFLRHDTGYPIPYRLKAVAPSAYVHTAGQVWAEPDEAAAAAAMVRVVEDRDDAARRGEAGRRFIDQRFGADNVGRIVEARLDEILMARAVRAQT